MSGNRRIGNAAEAFVQALLQQEHPDALVIPLQQDYGADLLVAYASGASFGGEWVLYEVKSSKVLRRALSAKLTAAEQALFDRYYPQHYRVVRVLRIPGMPRDTYKVVRRGT